ncbi:hypothetical protein EDB84DRAFT_1576114, partial [Lactarius hengduanensis]
MPAAPRPPEPSLLPCPRRHVYACGKRAHEDVDPGPSLSTLARHLYAREGARARDPLPSPFARKGGARALFPTTPRRPRLFPLVRAAPFARTGGVRRQPTSPRRLRPRPLPLVRTAPYARKGAREVGHPPSLPHSRGRGVREDAAPLPVAPDTSPSRPVRAGWRHAKACRPRPSSSPLGRATPYARARHPRPHPSPFAWKGARGHAALLPVAPDTSPSRLVRAGRRHARARRPRPHPSPFTRKGVHEGTRSPIPIAPGPSPLATPPVRAEMGHPSAHATLRAEGDEGMTPPAAPGTPLPPPASLLSAPSRSRGKGACEGKPPHPVTPRSHGSGRTRPSRVERQARPARS